MFIYEFQLNIEHMIKTEIGYYSVGNTRYSSKFEAVMAAQPKNESISWNFFDEILSKVNWEVEPNITLDNLYRIRAQQIRDQYDYIIVFCSGGADSNNVIRTFLNNNIRVDEVMALAPMSGLSNWDFNASDKSEDNTISETKFALFPLLSEITNRDPNIKITINDFFEDIVKYKDEYWAYKECGDVVTILSTHFTNVKKFKHISDMLDAGKRVGLVYGTDKPNIKITNTGEMLFIIPDGATNYLSMPTERQHPNLDRVLFYWTADLPEIMVKQSHVIAKMVQLPQYRNIFNILASGNPAMDVAMVSSLQDAMNYQIKNNLSVISKDEILQKGLAYLTDTSKKIQTISTKTIYQRTVVPFIYPSTYTQDLYQCAKVNVQAGFFIKDQAWLDKLHKNTRFNQMIISGKTALYNSISPKYLNATGTSFIGYFKAYKFGTVKDFAKFNIK